MAIRIHPDHLKIVQGVLEKVILAREVWASFGSRVNGTDTYEHVPGFSNGTD